MQLWFDFLSGYDLQIQIIIQIMTCDLKIKKTNQFKCDCDFDLQYCDLFQGLAERGGPEARVDEFTVAETMPLSTIDPEVANPLRNG